MSLAVLSIVGSGYLRTFSANWRNRSRPAPSRFSAIRKSPFPPRDGGFRTATLRGKKRLTFGGNRTPKILESFDPDKENPIPIPDKFHTIFRVNVQKFPNRFRDRYLSLAGNHAGH